MSIVVFVCIGTTASTAFAQQALQQTMWGPNQRLSMSSFDCASKNIGLILVQGEVELLHPDDQPGAQPPQILIKCDKLVFASNSKLKTRASLYIRAEKSISGAIDIHNTRGESGADAFNDPALYKPTKAEGGSNGGPGGGGHNALFSSWDYPNGRNAGNGGPGGNGGRGKDGRSGDGASDGRDGKSGASVTLKTRLYSPGTTIVINTRGGNGGKGAKGGRGQDGGDGGVGGDGGNGGDAAEGRSAGNGGNGGRGGDGGDGGRGGPGGNGGNGGAGGDADVLLIDDGVTPVGVPPSDITWLLEGGLGGEPGLGGDGGKGGKGMRGGLPGCGGSGAGLIKYHPKGDCGQQGEKGVDGRDGDDGPAGKFGVDGPPGRKGTPTWGYVKEKSPQ